MAKKPVMWNEDPTDIERFNPRNFRGVSDPSRIPGYYEIVQANDIAKADDLIFREKHRENPEINTKEDAYRMLGAHPQKLDVEFQWLPISGPNGESVGRVDATLDHYKNQQGFRLATKDDLESRGFGFPPAGRMAEDNTIRRGHDVALFVRDGKVARMWEKYKAEAAAKAEGNPLPEKLSDDAPTFVEEERSKEDIKH